MTEKKSNKQTVAMLIKRLFRWRRSIVIGTITAFVLACIIAFILPEYYKTRTTFYAASQDLATPEKIFGLSNVNTSYFGNNEEEDRIMAIAKSRAMYDFLIDSFDLFQYYDIDSSGSQAHYAIYNKIMSRYSISKSENDEIHIEFIDRDPAFTAKVVNAATRHLQQLGIKEIKTSQKGMMSNYNQLLDQKSQKLEILRDSLSKVKMKYKIIDPKTQAENLSSSLSSSQSRLIEIEARMKTYRAENRYDSLRKYNPILEGLREKVATMQSDTSTSAINISNFSEGSEAIYNIQQEIFKLTNSLNNARQNLNYLESTYNSKVPAIHIIEWAQTPEVKYWPQRKMLVLGITIMVFILLCMYALVREGFDKIDWKKLTDESA